ncbi:hypothetical protein KKB99_00755 [bacterium]|nr:hypothetical protein [bacterium]MBU1024515.1 hypothetical protein [bacterium]
MNLLKKQIPITIAFLTGIFMWWQYYIPHHSIQNIYNIMISWELIIAGFALVVGIYSLLHHHANKIRRKTPQWGFSVVVYIAMFAMVINGFYSKQNGFGDPQNILMGGNFQWMFNYIQVPMQATMFSLLAFYIVSAAYRSFRARTKEATILLITAVIVMMGRVPLGEVIFGPKLPEFTEWILKTPSMAAQRGILLGVGLAIVATSLRIIFGIERTYMGGGAD